MIRHRTFAQGCFALFLSTLLLSAPLPALAYVGPGLGGGVVATTLGIAAAILMLLAGVVWYPLKKIIQRLRAGKTRAQ